MTVITTKFPGSCSCGARVAAGSRVKWSKTAGIAVCGACAPKTLAKGQVEHNGTTYSVVIKGRNGRVTSASVGVCTMELVGNGALHFAADGSLKGIGAGSPVVRADLAHYIDGAKAAARKLAIAENLRK